MKRAGYSLAYILTTHAIALIVFFLFRLMLFTSINYEFASDVTFGTKAIAFIKGVWFDNVTACYITILPLAIMWIAQFFKHSPRWAYKFTAIFTSILYTIAFTISAANVPYFQYFFTNINSSIFNWFGYAGTTGGMIFGESAYILPILCGILSIIFIWIANIKLARYFATLAEQQPSLHYNIASISIYSIAGLTLVGLCAFGIRGRTGYNPIKVSQAYYCQDAFLNQLGISPTFNLLTSYLDDLRKENKPIAFIDNDIAIDNVKQYLNRQGIDGISPIARHVSYSDSAINKKNVIIILMESMSAQLMKRHGQKKTLTPFLDSLATQSCYFNNFYSSGNHTNHGITATLYSFPSILKRNAMKGTNIPKYSGLPTVLAEHGYHNMFFMTHESQYDNMNAFLRTNGFHDIYAQEDYPTEARVNSFGVPDDFLFNYALNKINEKASKHQPFCAVLLTISNHPPYVIPKSFTTKHSQPEDQIVEYADHAIANFISQSQHQPWWENTIFVLLGDHGKLVGTPQNEMPQSYNHIPFLIYGASIEPKIIDDLGGQIDVAPTLLSYLGLSHIQNNFGVNLNNEKREYIFYTSDRLIAARDSSHMYIYDPFEDLDYCYFINNGNFEKTTTNTTFLKMKNYCLSMLQASQHLIMSQLTTDKSH